MGSNTTPDNEPLILDEWLDRVRAEPPLPADERSSVELVHEGREETDSAWGEADSG